MNKGSSHQGMRDGKITVGKELGLALRCLYSGEGALHWDGVPYSPLGR